MINLQAPPMLSGTEEQQLISIRSYLFAMHQQLNRALNNLDETNFTEGGAARTVVAGGMGEGTAAAVKEQTSALRSLIVKNANYVKAEIDAIETELRSNYVAVSDYGQFSQDITTRLNTTAERADAAYDYTASVEDAVGNVAAEFDSYVVKTSGHITSGIVGYEEDGVTPIFGVAVGQDITTKKVVIGGVEQEEILPNNFLSIFTAKKLSFRQNDAEVAYLSNEKLYITTAHIMRKIEMADKWSIDTAKGFTIKWIG